MRRYVPHTERHGSVTIHGGDGSKWLADLQAENDDMPTKKNLIDGMRQSTGSARQQQAMNRLQHTPWEGDAHAKLSLRWTIGLGLFLAAVAFYAFATMEMPV